MKKILETFAQLVRRVKISQISQLFVVKFANNQLLDCISRLNLTNFELFFFRRIVMQRSILLILIVFFTQVNADNGIFSVNSVCMGFGCFPGDSSGLPITITNSGSYQLTSNIVSASTTTNVIEITADNVTLDLNGFSIIGPRTCTGFNSSLVCTNSGMTAEAIHSNSKSDIVIKNGSVKGFNVGINLGLNITSLGIEIDRIHASQNSTGVIALNGIISNSDAYNNEAYGFLGGEFSSLLINDSHGYSNKGGDAYALICSNVVFVSSAVSVCGFTNESQCSSGACP